MGILYDYLALGKLPIQERYESCYKILKNDADESLRVEALWAVGNLLELSPDYDLKEKIEDILVYVLKNDKNAIVRHEAAYQLGEHEVLERLPDLIDAILHDPNEVVRHESIEAVGLMRKIDAIKDIEPALKDHNESVRQTAELVIKQLRRLEKLQAAQTT